MKESPYQIIFDSKAENFNLKELIGKYLQYWYWFVVGIIICTGFGIFYMRYAPVIYETQAKIKILKEDEENLLALDSKSLLTGKSQINLENEIQVLKSYRIVGQVVDELRLDIDYFKVGNIKTRQDWRVPFVVQKKFESDSAKFLGAFDINLRKDGFSIIDEENVNHFLEFGETTSDDLPFNIRLADGNWSNKSKNSDYRFVLKNRHQTILNLSRNIKVGPTDTESDILALQLNGESFSRSEAIINTLIQKFDEDGIFDRQLVSQRTLDFIDDRFVYLTQELDSIETGKQSFKEANQLAYIEADAGLTLQRKAETEAEVSELSTQISIAEMLRDAVKSQVGFSLLPANVGLDNVNLNTMVAGYNELVLEREKMLPNMGERNPTLIAINEQMSRRLVNINKSLNIYASQLRTTLRSLRQDGAVNTSRYSALPEKERTLRAIERQQNLKENLFLVLLERREEAAINYAITTPSIKVIDYALTSRIPSAPKKNMVYGIAILSGLILPFIVLFFKFSIDTKITDRKDIENALPEIPLLAEIPFIPDDKVLSIENDRSGLGESFRILSTNLNFILGKSEIGQGQVIMCTSSVKGEGKTLLSIQLANAYASLNKKTLLIGADLRNPQLHSNYGLNKNVKGLSDYLMDPSIKWLDNLFRPNEKINGVNILFSGPIPPNAPQLLSSSNFSKILKEARKIFDIIIVDTAPTVLVTDTLLITELGDATVYVVRAEHSDKQLLHHIDNLNKTGKVPNMALVLNDVGRGNGYGYKYGYKYGYNYGYGYGYSEEKKKKPWYKFN